MQVECAAHDQAELFDINRLLIEIIRAALDGVERALAGAMTRGYDDFRIGLDRHNRIEHAEALGRAVRVRRQAEIERDDCRFFRPQGGDGGIVIAGNHDGEILIGPFQLRLQAFVILDDK